MQISIQPLNPNGESSDKLFVADFNQFLLNNDGFSLRDLADMKRALEMGSGYIIGEGSAGSYRLKKIN